MTIQEPILQGPSILPGEQYKTDSLVKKLPHTMSDWIIVHLIKNPNRVENVAAWNGCRKRTPATIITRSIKSGSSTAEPAKLGREEVQTWATAGFACARTAALAYSSDESVPEAEHRTSNRKDAMRDVIGKAILNLQRKVADGLRPETKDSPAVECRTCTLRLLPEDETAVEISC